MTHPGWGDKWADAPVLRVPAGPFETPQESRSERSSRPGGGPPATRWEKPRLRRPAFWTRRRRRALKVALPALAALLTALAMVLAWVVVDALRARSALEQAAHGVARLHADAVAGRTDGLDAGVAELRHHAAEARDATSGPHWSLAARLPGVGPTVEAVSTMAAVVDGLAVGALPQLAAVVRVADPAALAPRDGRIDLAPLVRVAPDVTQADQAIGFAQQRVARVGGTPMLPQVERALTDLEQQLAGLRASTATAARAAALIPPMLGGDGPRDYLVLVQNNAEPRALGGIVGTVLVLHADEGRIELTRQMPASEVGPFARPAARLTDDERAVFGDKVGRWMQNATATPDFPRTAQIARAMWARETGQVVDGVLAVDPAALAGMLQVTGPLEVGPGRRLAGAGLVGYLINGVYLTETPAGADQVFADVAETAFTSLATGGGRSGGMVDALAGAAREGRLLVWSAERSEAALLEDTVLGGGLRGVDGARPVVGVFTHGLQMAKIGYYLDTAVDVVERERRPDGSRRLDVTVTYTSRVDPASAARLPDYVVGRGEEEPGRIRVRSVVYAPAGGIVVAASENSEKIGFSPQKHDELSRVFDDIQLDPGKTASVTYVIISGKHQDGNVVVRTTPGPRPVKVTFGK